MRRLYPIPEGGVVLDAGANIGLFSVFALQEGAPDRLVAVEPVPSNVRLLRRNLAGFADRATVVEGALWSEEGRACFSETDKSNLGHLTSASGGEAKTARETIVSTLSPDSEGLPPPETIDYLKLDIEGAEWAVLDLYIRRLSPGSLLVGELHSVDTIARFGPLLRDRWRVIDDGASDCLLFSWSP